MDGWVELFYQNEWIVAWVCPRYYVPDRSYTRKQSDEEFSREFFFVREDILLLALFIRATQPEELSSVTHQLQARECTVGGLEVKIGQSAVLVIVLSLVVVARELTVDNAGQSSVVVLAEVTVDTQGSFQWPTPGNFL